MNATVNKVILMGNLGDGVKLRHFDKHNSVGHFHIATTDAYNNKEGVRIAQTQWHSIVVRNRLAEVCEKYLQKGDKVYLEGRLKTRKWESDGNVHYATEVYASSVKFLSNRKPPQNSAVERAHEETETDVLRPDGEGDQAQASDLPQA